MKKVFIPLLFSLVFTGFFSCKKDSEAPPATDAVTAKPIARQAEKFTVDTTASFVAWAGSKPTGKHTGIIKLLNGEIFIQNDSVKNGLFTLNMKSIAVTDVKNPEEKKNLEAHLKGLKPGAEDHFFNTGTYPEGIFEITGITAENGKTMIEGNLTLKGITKNITFPAAIDVTPNTVSIISEPFKINRILWKINFSSKSVFENLGNNYIDDDIEINITVKANR